MCQYLAGLVYPSTQQVFEALGWTSKDVAFASGSIGTAKDILNAPSCECY